MPFSTPNEFAATEFDYVIIGGGAAGLVLAGRLSEDSDVKVGVLEAGQDQSKNPLVTIPGLAMQTVGDNDLDWKFTTTPQVSGIWKAVMFKDLQPARRVPMAERIDGHEVRGSEAVQ